MSKPKSLNFRFLGEHDEILESWAAQAEGYVFEDPNAAIIKLRMLAEALAKLATTQLGFPADGDDRFLDALRFLQRRGAYTREIGDAFHAVRKAGNRAVHHAEGDQRGALQALRLTRNIAVWYHRAFSTDSRYKPGKFVPPPPPEDATEELEAELESLRSALSAERERADAASEAALVAETNTDASARAAWTELRVAIELAEQTESELSQERARFEDKLRALEVQIAESPKEAANALASARAAGADLELDEVDARLLIDNQLRGAGWEANTAVLSATRGVAPEAGRNLAIAEWPTTAGPADYVLFVGLEPVGTVEVKRSVRDLGAALVEAEDYANGLVSPDGSERSTPVPFAFATNGGAYVEGFTSESGIRVRGVSPASSVRSLHAWPSPDDLRARVGSRPDPINVALDLRPHVREAVDAAVAAAREGRRALVHIASGAGKSWAALGCVAGLLSEPLDGPVLLLGHFPSVENGAGPYDSASLSHLLGTGRVFRRDLVEFVAASEAEAESSDCRFGAVVVDECHPAALSSGAWRALPPADRTALWRQAIERVDAVRIGITATPETHAADLFGPPVFSYCHNTAIADGYLVPHAPPLELSFSPARARPLQLDTLGTLGEANFSDASPEFRPLAEDIGTHILQPRAERALADEIVSRVDPWSEGRALVIAASPRHADAVAAAIVDAVAERYGDQSTLRPIAIHGDPVTRAKLAKRFVDGSARIAVTDEATEPELSLETIELLAFARPIRSETSYSLALGTAARPSAGKTSFEVLHAFPRPASLPDLAPALRTGVPAELQLGGDSALVDPAEFKATGRLRFGRDGGAKEHLKRFKQTLEAEAESEVFAGLSSGKPTRGDVRLITLYLSRTGFTAPSLRFAANRHDGVDVEMGVLHWAAAELTGRKPEAARDALRDALDEARSRKQYTPAQRERISLLADAARRDGILDGETPEVRAAGGWPLLDRFLDGTLGGLAAELCGR